MLSLVALPPSLPPSLPPPNLNHAPRRDQGTARQHVQPRFVESQEGERGDVAWREGGREGGRGGSVRKVE